LISNTKPVVKSKANGPQRITTGIQAKADYGQLNHFFGEVWKKVYADCKSEQTVTIKVLDL
jgi:hypothetical protein